MHNYTSSDAIGEGVNGNFSINTLNEITHDDNSSTIFVKNKEVKSSTTATSPMNTAEGDNCKTLNSVICRYFNGDFFFFPIRENIHGDSPYSVLEHMFGIFNMNQKLRG